MEEWNNVMEAHCSAWRFEELRLTPSDDQKTDNVERAVQALEKFKKSVDYLRVCLFAPYCADSIDEEVENMLVLQSVVMSYVDRLSGSGDYKIKARILDSVLKIKLQVEHNILHFYRRHHHYRRWKCFICQFANNLEYKRFCEKCGRERLYIFQCPPENDLDEEKSETVRTVKSTK